MQHHSPAAGQEFNFFTEILPDWDGWLATLVIDANGNYVGADGTSKTIGNHTDLQLLLALRSKASVIVTTGATAKAEVYKPSRFAPIAVITRDPDSLAGLPLLKNPGEHDTIFLSSNEQGPQAFTDFQISLESRGYQRVLFEGGAKSLAKLFQADLPATFLLSIANFFTTDSSKVAENNLRDLLEKVVPGSALDLKDAFGVGSNLVTMWSRPQQ